ncbi:carboxypeptidase-like regulatory domain-containing protein [Gemmata palustris]|uniref:carboxypeptidase-like regulatory domain-containing protein n=1 Tax=Gemmata palustris TaxID=2822762 RepID=UPI001FEB6405|nr:carboxypeptidase-like regulatory domain-containing protein [Gemmata palustris]
MTRRLFGNVIWCAILTNFGCDSKAPPTPATTPVKGQILVQGKGVAGARVVFHPQFDVGAVKFAPGATTDKEGRFQLGSAGPSDGAPVGEYAVTFTWPEPTKNPDEGDLQVDRWRNKYNDPAKSKWKITIKEGDNQLEPFKID